MDVGGSSGSYGQSTLDDGDFLESWLSGISSRNQEPLSYSFGSSSTSAAILQGNAMAYNEMNTTVGNKSSDSSFGANYVVNDANLLLPNTAFLHIPGIRDSGLEFPSFAPNNSLVSPVMDGYPYPGLCHSNQSHRQGCKRQKSGLMVGSGAEEPGFDVYKQRAIRTETQLSKKPRVDANKDVLHPQTNQHFENSLLQLQEKNSVLKVLLEQQRQQNQLHKHLSLMGPEAPGFQEEQADQLQQWQLSQNQAELSSLPCLDGSICARRLTQYLFHTKSRPINNDMTYWKKFVSEYYAPCAKHRLCFSTCENVGQQALNLFTDTAMESWCCSICASKSSKGFEVIYETLPRIFKTKFESGMLDEVLFLGLPREHRYPSGLVMLEYGRVVQESIFENFRIVHEGILRVIFTPDLRIFSWEFCAQRQDELLQHRSLVRQIDHFVEAAEKYRSTVNNFNGASSKDLQSCCNMFVTAERELARNVDLPMVNELGFSKKHFRCLQIAEIVGSMMDLITISHELGVGPIESLRNYRRLKEMKERRVAHSLVTNTDGLAVDNSYSRLFRQGAHSSVARTQIVPPSYSTTNSSQHEFTNERMKSIEHTVDKLLSGKEATLWLNSLGNSIGSVRANEASGTATLPNQSSLGNSIGSVRANEASGTATLPQISDTIMLANAISFGDLAIAQANLMANGQLGGEMCKAAFNSSSSKVKMSVKVEPRFQEQV